MVALNSSKAASVQTDKKKAKKKKTNGDDVSRHHQTNAALEDPELLSRPAWVDAKLALNEVRKGKATGNKGALWLRSKMQSELFGIGRFVQAHAGKVLFVGLLVLLTFCVGLKSAVMESKIEKLWVEEGGRLEKELQYVEEQLGIGAGATNEMIIQTPKGDEMSGNILTPDALLAHLQILKTATRVVVEKDDTTWKLKDLCYAQTIPLSELPILDNILENLFPCAIITPLDCFWEGSKLLGPDFPVHIPLGDDEGSMLLSWTSLNPMSLLRQMSNTFSKYFDFDNFEDFMKRAGITSGYQKKPCLNPNDPDCPQTAPNKNGLIPDVGAELTGGCYGFATRYNHWPEALVVGGVSKNKSGHIVRAQGFQSVVQLMGEKDFYDYWSETYKTHTMEWSQEKAKEILSDWQKKFSEEVDKQVREQRHHRRYNIASFSSSNLDTVLEEFSEFSIARLAFGYKFMLIYVALTLFRWSDVVRSQSGLGLGGVLLVSLTIASGLGLCALIGITFNATTSQIVPFLALGLGVDAMFLMVQNYADQLTSTSVATEDQVGEVLGRTGVLIFVIGISVIAAFLLSSVLIPIPAIRSLGLQAAVLASCNLMTMILLFPALLALDLRRVVGSRMDLLCCYKAKNNEAVCFKKQQTEDENEKTSRLSVAWFAETYYGKWITKPPVKLCLSLCYIALTLTGIWGITKVQDGLSLTDIVPRNTSAFNFLSAQEKYFGFYNMYAVTKGNFEYPQNQKVLYDYHKAFVRVPTIIKDDNGGLPEFWLSLFRNWLVKVQEHFDDNQDQGRYHDHGWYSNATDEGILAFKLMVQTGHVDYPVDFTLLDNNRLVDVHGIINPSAFYNYLTAWYSNDAMAYSFSQVSIVPKPRDWLHDPRDDELRIPKSSPIVYAQIPFYLNNIGDTETMISTLRQVREICEKFENERGLPNFPRGIPFTFWEQYLTLRFWLVVALVAILAGIFVVVSIIFMSAWLSGITVGVIGLMLVQLFGLMGILGVKLSAIPALLLILAAGLGVQFTVHILMGFATSIGSKNMRVHASLSNMMSPVVHGAISTFLGILILAFSEFDFIYKYFFLVLTGLILLGLFNGLVFLPTLLSSFGPPAEVIPKDSEEKLAPITPPSSPPKIRPHIQIRSSPVSKNSKMPGLVPRRHHHSDISLSTIAEESNSYVSSTHDNCPTNQSQVVVGPQNASTSVFVEPEVVVETTTLPSNSSCPSSRCSSPTSQVTKVTATAKFKVEVHTSANGSSTGSSKTSSRRSRRHLSACNNTTNASATSSSGNESSASVSDGDPGFSEK